MTRPSFTGTVFLGVVGLVLAGYAAMAAQMATRLPSGQLGPGFFPQVIGVAAVAVCVVALLRGIRRPSQRVQPDGAEPDPAVHPDATALTVLATMMFFALLLVLGAVPAAAVFLLAMLTLLNRRHLVVNAAVAVALPAGMYLLFEVLLHAPLPAGVLWS
jgi:putative tricarboxylic transport membrane protein